MVLVGFQGVRVSGLGFRVIQGLGFKECLGV